MNQLLKIKVCGMRYPENRENVSGLDVDFLGFIFYPPSKRFVGNLDETEQKRLFETNLPKVGVFVDEEIDKILSSAKKYGLTHVQLHGNESPQFCTQLKVHGLKILKAFRVNEQFNFELVSKFEDMVDFVLFDTKAELPGGTGKKFNWNILDDYTTNIPFFLSGGINPNDVDEIKSISHPMFYGIDLNSRFEEKPGLKNIEKLKNFIAQIKQT